MNLYEELVWRGLIKDVAGEDLKDKLNNEKVTFYWGTDPTADSLHLGHYSSLITAKRLALAGHHPILLVGGATGLIGDPRPTSEREIIAKDTLNKNLDGISRQVDKIFNGMATVVNNYDWMKDYNYLEFLTASLLGYRLHSDSFLHTSCWNVLRWPLAIRGWKVRQPGFSLPCRIL